MRLSTIKKIIIAIAVLNILYWIFSFLFDFLPYIPIVNNPFSYSFVYLSIFFFSVLASINLVKAKNIGRLLILWISVYFILTIIYSFLIKPIFCEYISIKERFYCFVFLFAKKHPVLVFRQEIFKIVFSIFSLYFLNRKEVISVFR